MKNLLHLLLAAGVVGSVSACGGSDEPPPTGDDAGDAAGDGDVAADDSAGIGDDSSDVDTAEDESLDVPEAGDDSDVEPDVEVPPPCEGLAYDERPDGTFACYSAACELPSTEGESAVYTVEGWVIAVDAGTGAFTVTPPHGGEPVFETDGPCENPESPALRVGIGQPSVMNDVG